MTYKEAESYLFRQLPMFQRSGPKVLRKMDLDQIKVLMNALGNPHLAFKSILIAGTNGKGSTSNFIAAMLQSAGFTTGLYTSPHYTDYRERIRIDGVKVEKQFVTSFVERIKSIELDFTPSFFEISVAMAFEYFKEKQVDYAVVEVGLGGRLDSTNILHPELCVITNIGWDHMNFLGDTLEKIAGEKAGIIKESTPVVIGKYQEEVAHVFDHVANEKSSEISYASDLADVRAEEDFGAYHVTNMDGSIVHIQTDFGGHYQAENLRTAIAAIRILEGNRNFNIDLKSALSSVRKMTGFKGRFQVLNRRPFVMVDSAHNVDGLSTILPEINALRQHYSQLHIVLAMVGDKDVDKVLQLLPGDAKYYFSKADIPRGMPAIDLKKQAEAFGLHGKVYTSVRRALAAARMSAKKDGMILVTGSIFTVAEVV